MIGNDGIDFFKSNYEIIESTTLYDVYQSKYKKIKQINFNY